MQKLIKQSFYKKQIKRNKQQEMCLTNISPEQYTLSQAASQPSKNFVRKKMEKGIRHGESTWSREEEILKRREE